jgi:cytochrome c5
LRHQDEQFFDSFMLVIGILIGVAVGLFFLVRMISVDTQDVFVREDPAVMAAIDERIRPIGRVVLLGDEELAAAPAIVAAPAPAATQMTGPQVYNAACTICHGTGVGGAPVTGDGAAWAARIEQGVELMVRHAIDGFTGAGGYMPPKGGRVDLSDEEVTLAVEYMVEQVQ